MHLSLDPLPAHKKIYFASDFHLGVAGKHSTRDREQKIVDWLESIREDAHAIFLVGDVFDFWFEYKRVVPKGFVRLLGKLAQITDSGIPVFFFSGNHDMWMFDYFPKELNIPVFHEPQTFRINGHHLYIGHGDGLGPGDHTYKILKRIFRSGLSQWFFRWLHPDLGVRLAHSWSRKSRLANEGTAEVFNEDDEWLLAHCRDIESKEHHDYYIFGHRHLPIDEEVANGARYINLGEWVNHYTYGEYDGDSLQLKNYSN
jgi:UDP-2,3-diacylglucosamine hydrolase